MPLTYRSTVSHSDRTIDIDPEAYYELMEYMTTNRKIDAIKYLRSIADLGLKEAKEAVELLGHIALGWDKNWVSPQDQVFQILSNCVLHTTTGSTTVMTLAGGTVVFDTAERRIVICKGVTLGDLAVACRVAFSKFRSAGVEMQDVIVDVVPTDKSV